MMIDENLTPMGGEEAQKPEQSAGAASDAPTMVEPSPDETPIASNGEASLPTEASTPEPQREAEPQPERTPQPEPEPEPRREPEPDPLHEPEPEPLPGSEPQEPVRPVTPGDPRPPQPRAEDGGRDEQADADLFESYMAGSSIEEVDGPELGYKRLSRGDRVEATVVQVERDRVFVDLGTKSEGIVPLSELTDLNVESARDLVQIGDKINVVVIRPEGGDSNPIVSKKRADFEEAWDRIEDALKNETMINAQVVDRVKGGLVVDVGVRGFVPATHVGNGKLRNIEKYVGQPLQLKVIEIDRERKKVVLSNRQAEEQRRESAKEEIFKSVAPGDILDGTVRRLTDYGAFVDLGGVDGLLHISEMSWMRINHPKEIFKEGQKIKVMVLRLDEKAGKISLGHRQVLPDPWNLIKQNYKVGQTLKVQISRIVQSGAFIKLPEGAEAFMPVSEMSFRRIRRPDEVVTEGQEVESQVIDLRPEERRMVLSMKATGAATIADREASDRGDRPPSGDFDDDRGRDRLGAKGKKKPGKGGGRRGREEEDFDEAVGRRGFATGGATIGERLGMLKGFLGRDEFDEDEVDDKETTEPEAEATEE